MLRLLTLGRLVVEGEQGPLAGAAAQPKRLAVLALLAAAGERGLARDRLAALLWPDAAEENARRSVAQAIYSLRQELGSDDAIVGTRELRLNAEVVATDLADFERALRQGRLESAAEAYDGPFLDGFRLAGSPEFERWADEERRMWAERYAGVLSQLATRAADAGDGEGAVRWSKRLAAQDPLSATYALGLMRALSAAGDVPGALQHARVYETLVEQELELPPDPAVVRLVGELRRDGAGVRGGARGGGARGAGRGAAGPPPVAAPSPNERDGVAMADATSAVPAGGPPPTTSYDPPPEPPQPAPRADQPAAATAAHVHRDVTRRIVVATTLLVVCAVIGAVALFRRDTGPMEPAAETAPVVVVGRIADYGSGPSGAAGPLGDMLATNLARAPGLQVVSGARMYELLGRVAAGREPTSDDVSEVARRAGASEIVDGAVYRLPEGGYRLDLRRVEIATGRVRAAYTVSGGDLFAVADSATARLVDGIGAARPTGSIADVTTRSIAAYRLYEQGLRAYGRLDVSTADQLFASALQEDPQFAMAALYHAFTSPDPNLVVGRLARALPLARRASERERLIIEAQWAQANQDRNLRALADSLVRKYPLEVEGHLLLARSLLYDQQSMEAIPSLRRVVAMDSAGLSGTAARCSACEALQMIADAYVRIDSLDASLAATREWTRLQPRSAAAQSQLAVLLSYAGRTADALAAFRVAEGLSPAVGEESALNAAYVHLRASDFARADSAIAEGLASPRPRMRREALWWRHYSLRAQGRLREAMHVARTFRAEDSVPARGVGAARAGALLEAITHFEAGRHREAAALYDSLARRETPEALQSLEEGQRIWYLAHGAAALAAARDTARLRRVTDTLELLGRTNPMDRNRRLHHFARGLLETARARDADAERELRHALGSPSMGYSRVSLALAGVLRRRESGRREAVALLQPTFRGDIQGSGLYATTTERHEALADAWRDAGGRDSAAAHYRITAASWGRGDPPFAARAARARRLADSLASAR